jgi:hypothetical protein
MNLSRTKVEWVAQVSLLRPGFSLHKVLATLGVNPFARGNPGLKSETWATHSTLVQLYFRQSAHLNSTTELSSRPQDAKPTYRAMRLVIRDRYPRLTEIL